MTPFDLPKLNRSRHRYSWRSVSYKKAGTEIPYSAFRRKVVADGWLVQGFQNSTAWVMVRLRLRTDGDYWAWEFVVAPEGMSFTTYGRPHPSLLPTAHGVFESSYIRFLEGRELDCAAAQDAADAAAKIQGFL